MCICVLHIYQCIMYIVFTNYHLLMLFKVRSCLKQNVKQDTFTTF